MMTIIDRTMCYLDSSHTDIKDLEIFWTSLFISGVTHIEMTPDLFFKVCPDLKKQFSAFNQLVSCLIFLNEYQQFSMMPNPYQDLTLDSSFNFSKYNRISGISDLMEFERLYSQSGSQFISVNFSPDNSLHCATALAMEWFSQGGEQISLSFTGIGSMAPLEEVLMGLYYHFPEKFTGDLSALQMAKKIFESISKKKLAFNKPILGDSIFKVESGIHVDGILKNPEIYEPFDPNIIGQERKIVLGKHSGQKSIHYKLKDYQLSDSCLSRVLQLIKEKCTRLGRNLSDSELVTLMMEVENDSKIYC